MKKMFRLYKKAVLSYRAVSSLILILAFVSFSCSNPAKNNKATNTPGGNALVEPNAASPIDTKLDILYLENFAGHNELQKLFLPSGKKVDKLVFEFFHTNKDSLTLIGWSAETGNRKIDKTISIVLHRLKTSSLDIAGTNIILGNQETKDKTSLDEIYKVINKPNYEYIIFTPKPDSYAGRQHVYYSIDGVSSLDKALNPLNITTTNPSPPYEGL